MLIQLSLRHCLFCYFILLYLFMFLGVFWVFFTKQMASLLPHSDLRLWCPSRCQLAEICPPMYHVCSCPAEGSAGSDCRFVKRQMQRACPNLGMNTGGAVRGRETGNCGEASQDHDSMKTLLRLHSFQAFSIYFFRILKGCRPRVK